MDADVEVVLDDHVRWIDAVTEAAAAGDWPFVQRAIAKLEDEQLPGLIFVLISARANDLNSLREATRDLAESDDPVLH